MKTFKILSLIGIMILMSCGSSTVLSSNDGVSKKQITPEWGDWRIFPIKDVADNRVTIHNDLLMYRVKYLSNQTNVTKYRYDVQFKNTSDDIMKLNYNLFSQQEKSVDTELVLKPDRVSKTYAHMFKTNLSFFIQVNSYENLNHLNTGIGVIVQTH